MINGLKKGGKLLWKSKQYKAIHQSNPAKENSEVNNARARDQRSEISSMSSKGQCHFLLSQPETCD